MLGATAPTTAFDVGAKVDDPMAMYMNDVCTIPSNLSGHPAVSVPFGVGGRRAAGGVQVLAPALQEALLFRVARVVEDHAPPAADGVGTHMSTDWEMVIGLEVHCELQTATKLFCGCRNAFGDEPNVNICPTCLGLPGSLPVLNEQAVEFAMRIGAALHCEIRPSEFARKNYFYPDQAKDYQISQYDLPLNARRVARAPRRVPGRRDAGPHGGGHRQAHAHRGERSHQRGARTRWSTTTARASRWSRS